MLGVIIGVASVILLVSLGSGLQKYITDQLEGIGSNLIMIMPGKLDMKKMGGGGGGASFMSSKLELKDIKALEADSDYIKAAIPFVAGQKSIKYNEEKMYTKVLGTTANFNEVVNSPLSYGDYFTEADDRSGRKVIILGSEIANTLFGQDNPVGEKVLVGEDRFIVVGVLKNKSIGGTNMEDGAVIPFTTAQRIFNQDKVTEIYAQAVSPDKMDLAIEEARLTLLSRLNEDDFTILTQKEMLGAVSSILGVLTSALAGIAAISLLVGGIGIMNIMLVSVTERTREIGLRKALGATPNLILTQFLIEAIILSVGGGLIGIILGGGGALALSKVMPADVTPSAVLLAFGVSAFVGIIFGVMPARRAAKLNPIEALRYE
jgi:putative ABC transport system permease protein